MRFRSPPRVVGKLSRWPAANVKSEPMLYRADPRFALANGGPITKEFVTRLLELNEVQDLKPGEIVIDSRVHMLMRGWFPCIPGWHQDDVPRSLGPAGWQPNYDAYNPKKPTQLLMAVIDAHDAPTHSLTEFCTGVVDVPWPLDVSVTVYGAWDSYLNSLPKLATKRIESGDLIRFDSNSMHRGTPAHEHGFRYFIRAFWHTHEKPANEVRRNANVYMQWSTAGW